MAEARPLPANVRLAAFDVDGVLTDGRFWLSADGVETKAFHTQDGYGLKMLLRAGVEVAIISSRSSEAVRLRMDELGVRHVLQGIANKVEAFRTLIADLKLSPADCVYAGDDMPDLPLLQEVGFAVAVANAVPEIKAACDYTTRAPGGAGAVREICEMLLRTGGGSAAGGP